MTDRFVNIHTHRPTGRGIELRTAGIHPWNADKETLARSCRCSADVQAVGETGLDFVHGADRETQLAAVQRASSRWRANGGCPWFCTASGLSSRSCANWTPAGPAQRSSTASSDRPNRPAGPSEKVITSRSACVPFASPKTLESLRETPLSQLFSRNRRQRRPDRGNLRARRESERRHAGGTATGDAGKLRTDIYDRPQAGQGAERRRSRPIKRTQH